ncbi:uncharacterized protein LOC125873565 [Solanum stenotomum]|uniref:uncharacterized protein LOC125873565 n=1 Tax=Solanum stenotomum TaxID=172797 RepID=UPI0020D0B2B1|nr:uncharacterized protein LOC125873565 [Solanum stenotomum]
MRDSEKLQDQSDSNVNSPALLNLSNDKHSEKAKREYRILLSALIDVARFILKQGLPFLTDEERKCLEDNGNFEAFLEWYGNHVVPDVGRVISENAEMHQNMIAPSVLKNIVNVCAKETIKRIVEDLNGDYFGILVDKSDGSCDDNSAQSLKETIDSLITSYSLSPSKIRAQGYNGDANMESEINDLKTLILQDNLSAYCTHHFAQPLHLTLVSVAKRQRDVDDFFGMLSFMLKVIGVSFERQDFSQENQVENLEELLKFGNILTGRDFNQKYGKLERSGNAPLESYFETLRSFITIFPSVVHILEVRANPSVAP